MRSKCKTFRTLEVVLLFICLVVFPVKKSHADEYSKYLKAVREFADNVLKYGRDTYGPKHTPLFVDGLNIHTHEPVKWISPKGDYTTATDTEEWILSNLASQQNLFRVLDGLTKITGDPKYRRAAVEAIKYAFANLRSQNGLLYWGGHAAYDARSDKPCGRSTHELKGFYPYYELMWEVDPNATKGFIEAFWSGHILDWSNLDMNRHAEIDQALNKAWDYEYKGEPVFWGGKGFGPLCTGSDLFYAAAWLTKLSGDKKPLVWSKRLAHRYVETRNPKTGISHLQFNKKITPDISIFPYPHFSNPIFWQNTRYYRMPTPEMIISPITREWLCQCLLGEMLNSEGGDFIKWAREELTAIGKTCYRKQDNAYVPIFEDGTSREGYLCTNDGVWGFKGTKLVAIPARPYDFWAYAVAYGMTDDSFMWEIARSIAAGNKYGDIGVGPTAKSRLTYDSTLPEPYGLLGFLELYRKSGNRAFLRMAERIGDTMLADRFHNGFFVGSAQHVFCKFDAIDPLVLLHLHTAVGGQTKTKVPQVWPGTSFFDMAYRNKEEVIDNLIYIQTEFPLPMSLQEAAAIGDLELIKSLVEKGDDVNGREDAFFKTPLHRAAISGRKDVVEFLLVKGADINARAGAGGLVSALHYAVENGHTQVTEILVSKGAEVNAKNGRGNTTLHFAASSKETGKDIFELLITKGADVNAKNNADQTPLDIALQRNRNDIVKLLIAKGADVSLHVAARFGALAKVKSLIAKGADVNAKDTASRTPLHYAARSGHKEIVEVLLAHGADVNIGAHYNLTAAEFAMQRNHNEVVELLVSKGADISPLHIALYMKDEAKARSLIESGADVNKRVSYGTTPLDRAVNAGLKDIVVLLIEKGANVNARDNWNWTPLHSAAEEGHRELAELLIAKGANVNARDGGGRTPLRYAERKGHTEIAELLRKHGAKE
jgi:pectate lyase